MDLRYSDAEQAFRSSLRAWLEATLPGLPDKPSPEDWPGRRAYDTHWQRLLFEAGYAGITWPNTRQIAEKQMKDLTEEQVYKIVRGNAIKLYDLDFK